MPRAGRQRAQESHRPAGASWNRSSPLCRKSCPLCPAAPRRQLSAEREALGRADRCSSGSAAIGAEKDLDRLRQNAIAELRRQTAGRGPAHRPQLEGQIGASLPEKNEQIAGAIQNIKQQIETLRQESQHTAEEIVRVSQEREELEASTSGIRNAQKEKIARRETVSRELAKLDEQKVSMQKEYDNIITKMWEEYQMTRSEAAQIAVELPDLITARRDLNEIKNKIKCPGKRQRGRPSRSTKRSASGMSFMLEQVGDVERSRERAYPPDPASLTAADAARSLWKTSSRSTGISASDVCGAVRRRTRRNSA